MLETNELSQRAGDGLSPEEQLRGFVRVFVSRLTGEGPNAWVHRLMAREMERPTEVLDQVMQQVLKPRIEYLCGVIAAIMQVAPADPRVMRCVSSLQVQCLVAGASDSEADRQVSWHRAARPRDDDHPHR